MRSTCVHVCVRACGALQDERTAQLKKLVQGKLKGRVEDSAVELCTHVVFVKPLKRTAKLCAALSMPGVILVTDEWITACESAKAFVDTRPYVLAGEFASNKGAPPWAFNATDARKRALAGSCLGGYSFYITPWAKPTSRYSDAELSMIVRCAGGELLARPPTAGSGQVVVISTEEERAQWSKLAKLRNVSTITAHHLLNCMLNQRLDLSTGRLE